MKAKDSHQSANLKVISDESFCEELRQVELQWRTRTEGLSQSLTITLSLTVVPQRLSRLLVATRSHAQCSAFTVRTCYLNVTVLFTVTNICIDPLVVKTMLALDHAGLGTIQKVWCPEGLSG